MNNKDILPIEPQDEVTIHQVRAIREATGCGLIQAKKYAIILNDKGVLTWDDIHRYGGFHSISYDRNSKVEILNRKERMREYFLENLGKMNATAYVDNFGLEE